MSTKQGEIKDLFLKYGYEMPMPWTTEGKTKKDPKKDCFAYRCRYIGRSGTKEECTALNRMYCQWGKCNFYKQSMPKALNVEKGVQNG